MGQETSYAAQGSVKQNVAPPESCLGLGGSSSERRRTISWEFNGGNMSNSAENLRLQQARAARICDSADTCVFDGVVPN